MCCHRKKEDWTQRSKNNKYTGGSRLILLIPFHFLTITKIIKYENSPIQNNDRFCSFDILQITVTPFCKSLSLSFYPRNFVHGKGGIHLCLWNYLLSSNSPIITVSLVKIVFYWLLLFCRTCQSRSYWLATTVELPWKYWEYYIQGRSSDAMCLIDLVSSNDC